MAGQDDGALRDVHEPGGTDRTRDPGERSPRGTDERSRTRRSTLIVWIPVALIMAMLATVAWSFMASSDEQALKVFYGGLSRKNKSLVIPIPANSTVEVAGHKQAGTSHPLADATYTINSFDPETGLIDVSITVAPPTANAESRVPKQQLYLNDNPVTLASTPFSDGATIKDQEVATGTAEAFPSDSYQVGLLAQLTILTHQSQEVLPNAALYIKVGPRLNSFVVTALRPGETDHVSLLISRQKRVIVWYYAIALAPAVLILTLLWQLINNARPITLEAGIGIIAILPLRQVIVPSDIIGITRIDILLGFEVIAMILLVALGAIFGRSSQEPT
jgi:hypothetical protein